MIDDLLRAFQPDNHPYILVEDPDQLLNDETARATLLRRGYRLLDEADSVRLRHEAGAPGSAPPTILLTRRPPNELPYDWWATAHHVTLRLAERYPNLNATVLREVTGVEQRWRLAQAAPPPVALGRRATADYLLRAVYDFDVRAPITPAALVDWLARRHDELPGPLPPSVGERLLAVLAAAPPLAGWPLAELVDDGAAFGRFVAGQWRGAVARMTGGQPTEQSLAEPGPVYRLNFAADPALQDVLPALVRRGALPRLAVSEGERLPAWARPAIMTAADERLAAARDLLARLDEQAAPLITPETARWAGWVAVARTWAELTGLALDVNDAALDDAIHDRRPPLDAAFATWLRRGYPALAGKKLPQPHHVHHALHLMAHERRRDGRPVALLVLDGLSLADWLHVGRVWRARHPSWRVDERDPLLAQIPTITAVSRQALVSGRPPREFAATLGHNNREPAHWAAFWAGEGLSGAAARYERLRDVSLAPGSAQAVCLVYTGLDDRLHGATQGAAEAWASLGVWLDRDGRVVEAAVGELLAAGFAVYVGSDHGHTEAWGIGQPREGETAESRGKRSRLYRTRETAAAQQAKVPATVIWEPDGVLPDGLWALLPTDQPARGAFALEYQIVVAHGGVTLEEVVVPFARIAG